MQIDGEPWMQPPAEVSKVTCSYYTAGMALGVLRGTMRDETTQPLFHMLFISILHCYSTITTSYYVRSRERAEL